MTYFGFGCVVLYLLIVALWFHILQKRGHTFVSCLVASFLWLPTVVVGQIMELWHDKVKRSH